MTEETIQAGPIYWQLVIYNQGTKQEEQMVVIAPTGSDAISWGHRQADIWGWTDVKVGECRLTKAQADEFASK